MTRKKKPDALARREESVLARDVLGSRTELVKALDAELRVPGGKDRAMRAILEAAQALAPIFSVTSVKSPGEHFSDDAETHPILDTAIVVEILCSAGSWLAHARGMEKKELLEKFEEWAKDNGYD